MYVSEACHGQTAESDLGMATSCIAQEQRPAQPADSLGFF